MPGQASLSLEFPLRAHALEEPNHFFLWCHVLMVFFGCDSERENEEHQKALNLVTQREQHYGGALWGM
jgi:hypothetical protein